jgi:hypothetical protein
VFDPIPPHISHITLGAKLLKYQFLSESAMQTTKQEVTSLLERLPESSSLEDVQYHLYVIEKIRRGLERAETDGALSQAQAEDRLGKWLVKS